MNTDILFITPTAIDTILEESLGTLLLATILKNNNFQVKLLRHFEIGDPCNFNEFLASADEQIVAIAPKIISFYTRCDTYHIILKIAERIKTLLPDTYVVFAGPQADISAADTIHEMPFVDFVCCGEGETTIVPLVSSLTKKKPDLSIPGLVYRKGNEVIQNPRPELLQDLNNLPMVDYAIAGVSENQNNPLDDRFRFPIDVGRGCPFGCTYCSTKTFWGRKYRLKSPERIIAEIKDVHQRFGITSYAFNHDMFTMNKRQVLNTCKLLKKLDFPLIWRCSARLDCIDKEMIDVMADCGLANLYFGVESGSPRMQKLMNKNLKLDQVMSILSYVQAKNIKMTVSFIYGVPEETEDDVSQTITLISKIARLKGVAIQTHLCTFLPGTELSTRYIDQMTPAETLSDITGTTAVTECRDLINAHPKLFQHFMEYKTELRYKLRFFSTFIKVWRNLLPVYQYISEKYDENHLIEMYYDFVNANIDLLEKTKDDSPREQYTKVINDERFVRSFAGDKHYDLMADYCRLKGTTLSLSIGESAKEIVCFSPSDLDNGILLQDCKRAIVLVTCVRKENGNVKKTQVILSQL